MQLQSYDLHTLTNTTLDMCQLQSCVLHTSTNRTADIHFLGHCSTPAKAHQRLGPRFNSVYSLRYFAVHSPNFYSSDVQNYALTFDSSPLTCSGLQTMQRIRSLKHLLGVAMNVFKLQYLSRALFDFAEIW